MTQKLTARIIRPESIEHEVQADMVVMPGSEGEFGVMYGHVPMVVQLKSGEVKIHNAGAIKAINIDGGIAKVTHDGVDVVCG
jgi:F-type H+-transporting ATPase subunit epsilon